MIQAGIIFYNDTPQMLEKCLKSIQSHVEKIVAIDGAFKEFPHDKPWSTDGCLDIAHKYAHEVVETREAWPDQATKRNAYFTLKREQDWYLILDTDEYLFNSIPDKLFGDCYRVLIERWMDPVWLTGLYCRLIRHREDIHYEGKHNHLIANGKLIRPDDETIPEMNPEEKKKRDGRRVFEKQD
jgi:glycosyltransferase involved in cell wall biosynthesis